MYVTLPFALFGIIDALFNAFLKLSGGRFHEDGGFGDLNIYFSRLC